MRILDLREAEEVTSGTPFLNAAKLSEQYDQEFNYLCIGVAKHSNTKVLFETADRLNCTYIFDHELQLTNLENLSAKINAFIEKVDDLYITVDLDVFSCQHRTRSVRQQSKVLIYPSLIHY